MPVPNRGPAMADPTHDPFEAAYERHHDAVWRCLRALGVPYPALDDATQDVFVVVHRRLPDFDHASALGAWILGIARNVARKYRERQRPRPMLDVIDRHTPESPDTIIARRRAAALVQAFVDALPTEQREVFVLIELHGLTAPQVAEQTSIPLNTVYSRLRLARRRFDRTLARQAARRQRPA